MTKQLDICVFVGRVQPLHNAHLEMIKRAAEISKKVIIIIGSSSQPRSYKNPWTDSEREQMVSRAIASSVMLSDVEIKIEHNYDSIYNDQAWVSRVQGIVNQHIGPSDTKIGIIGHKKDSSTFYLDSFPQWEFIDQELIEPLNATDIRELYFKDNVNLNYLRNVVPESTMQFLTFFMNTMEYQVVLNERKFIERYQASWAAAPYPVNLVCVDACVVKSGHVLMVKRRSYPGKGLMALPGGYLNVNETVKDGMIRELREETKLKVPTPVLEGSIVKKEIFDHPTRSSRGRVLTVAYLIDLGTGMLPKVKGADDAEIACWVPINELSRETTFEDHYSIIEALIGGF